ncbi:MFS transporter [Allokutzneria albata]|uniref:Predicted arabinose efflux permease, MFS family n=1 Tax=Allokutzneria albata TaxID=211114 RepID=A0A1G9RWW5_ALLAB|nr:MFS transporter [Allokutzneria albata]SDM27721.1 Predicted arabinose efflux permease, MFS family [Allokutzneria albata]
MADPLGRSYWTLWTSSGLSNLADGIVKIALPLVAVQFTRSPALIAGLAVALTIPWLLFALPAGALADRLDRRRAMLGANLVRTLALGVLTVAVLTGFGSIWALYAVALCLGTAETIYDTSAQSIIPQIVPRDRLSGANRKLYAVELTANEFVGPPLAGLLVTAGAALVFGAPVALWALAVTALLLVRGSFRVEREHRTTLRADIAEGLRFLTHHRILRTLAMMVGTSNFASNAMFAVFVLHAVGPSSAMGLSERSFGLLLTTFALGSLLGSFVAERIERALGRPRALTLTVLGTAGIVGTPALTTNPFVIGGAFFLGGIGIMTWNVITVSLRQRITPDRLLGRVNSGYRLLAWGSMPLGSATGGLIAQLLGVTAVFLVMAPLVLAQLIGMRVLTEANLRAAEEGEPHRTVL